MKMLHGLDLHQTSELLACLFLDKEYDREYEDWLEENPKQIEYGECISVE